MEKKAVTNTSSLIFIGKLRLFDLLKNVFDNILVPGEVINELLKKDTSEVIYIKKELGIFLKEASVKKMIHIPLGDGEKAAISLCMEKNIKTFLSDDKKARSYARSLKIETMGVVGIILENLKMKKINKREARRLLDDLIKNGYYINSDLYSKITGIIGC